MLTILPFTAGATPVETSPPKQLHHQSAEESAAKAYASLLGQPLPDERAERLAYLRQASQFAMRLDRLPDVIAHLEQLILLAPHDLGSRLDLSIAYLATGNPQAASASLQALHRYRGDDPMPPAAAQAIRRLEQRLQRVPGAQEPYISASASLAHGYDSNVNLGPSRSLIDLVLWGELPFQAELDEASLPQASRYSELTGELEYPLGNGNREWAAAGRVMARQYHDLDRLHRHDLQVSLRWRPSHHAARFDVSGVYQHIDSQGEQHGLQSSWRMQLGNHWLTVLGLEWERDTLGRQQHRLQSGLWREWRGWQGWLRASHQWRPERESGDTQRAEVGLGTPAWQLGRAEIQAYAQWELRRDAEPYSPAFFGDTQRRERHATLGISGRYPFGERLSLQVDARWERTQANIDLFEHRRWQLESRLNWRW
ncbi:tetratricopeptide repeat protein [Halomonas tibetensis]|uniref:Tetratricopeptide repeat protein n=1 Tax=Halomonas tibetensis TaxID=2259590 RepID=A0ABV7B6K4_9GAMM